MVTEVLWRCDDSWRGDPVALLSREVVSVWDCWRLCVVLGVKCSGNVYLCLGRLRQDLDLEGYVRLRCWFISEGMWGPRSYTHIVSSPSPSFLSCTLALPSSPFFSLPLLSPLIHFLPELFFLTVWALFIFFFPPLYFRYFFYSVNVHFSLLRF